ncbi:unnamed protein product [Paramecium sonneborni]|uniref:LITAF domain-containing protein n=1 Tax=Paramecium sonneborni TaxID=65129 RepID=A0A8S1NXB8_9CILI|nr:unnamed protein product [Paramecium sonneborni]CAD8096212.1 unnamed protein product [Paramecium sonneborni]
MNENNLDTQHQQTKSAQSQRTIKSDHIELQVNANYLITEENSFSKVPQTRKSEQLFCQKCNIPVVSDIFYEMGKGSYVIIFILLALIITAFFTFIPCMLNRCKDAQHRCPKCTKLLGTKQFLYG